MTDPAAWDPTNPAAAIKAAAARCSNWGRWGPDDRIGTLNHLSASSRVEAAALIRRGAVFSLAQPFDTNAPQTGWRRRTNPVHTMLSSGLDPSEQQHFPHGISGADDVVFMPLQCSTKWDGLGHIFDHGQAWNGRRAADTVTSDGEDGELADGPFHQVAIPHMGLTLGEMWDLDALAADCAGDGVYEFLLCAPAIPFTGAVGSPVNPIAIK